MLFFFSKQNLCIFYMKDRFTQYIDCFRKLTLYYIVTFYGGWQYALDTRVSHAADNMRLKIDHTV